MNLSFAFIGLDFTAEVDFEPLVPARISGPPEDCYPAEGGYATVCTLKCGASDATFLMESDLEDALNDAAYAACVEQLESDREDAAESRAAARML
jgi:hypothetical protein